MEVQNRYSFEKEPKGCSIRDVKIIILGQIGSGKSSLANNLLGDRIFEVGLSGRGITTDCKMGTRERFGRDISVLDTPGFYTLKRGQLRNMMKKQGTPNAVFLVLRLDRLTKDIEKLIKEIENCPGVCPKEKIFIIFTGDDILQQNNMFFEDFLHEFPQRFSTIKDRYKGRIRSVDNTRFNEEQIRKLIEEVDFLETDPIFQ